MADVRAVADQVAVLRLGRNNGVFKIADTSHETIISAITGATDNAVTRRQARVANATDQHSANATDQHSANATDQHSAHTAESEAAK
jgi:D-xylose transport system ATP-binding protein